MIAPQDSKAKQARSPWTLLLLIATLFFFDFLSRIILTPFLVSIKADMGLSNLQTGGLFLYLTSGFSVTLFCQGIVSSRLKHRKTIILAITVIGVAMISFAFSRSLVHLKLGLVLLGVGSGLYPPSGIALITALFEKEKWGRALAVHESIPSFSFILAPLIAEFLMLFFPWRGALAVIGFMAIGMGVIFALFYSGDDFAGKKLNLESFRAILARPSFWMFLFIFAMMVGANLGVYRVLPLYLVDVKGMDREGANFLLSLSRLSGVVMIFIGGWLVDRWGIKRTLFALMAAAGLFTMLLAVKFHSPFMLAVFLQPVFSVSLFPAGMAALSLIGGYEMRNITISLTLPLAALLGSAVVPAWLGYCADKGIFAQGFMILGAMILAAAALVLRLRLEE
jgi:NNP family nitrate/nitrite transporter-like MFS transporter